MAMRQIYAKVDIREVERLLGTAQADGDEFEAELLKAFCDVVGIPYEERKVEYHRIKRIVESQNHAQAEHLTALFRRFKVKA